MTFSGAEGKLTSPRAGFAAGTRQNGQKENTLISRKVPAIAATILASAILLAAAILLPRGGEPLGAGGTRSAETTSAADKAFAEEQEEFEEKRRARTEAADEAPLPLPEVIARGTERAPEVLKAINYIPGKVWNGEELFGNAVDWEPDIAADPSAPHVYWLTTRYGSRYQLCNDCPSPLLVYRVSPDNGATWGPVMPLCKCKGYGWQADPQVEVADDGTVYALILQKWRTMLTKSTDHGVTWTAPVDVAKHMNWTDHGFLTISDDGQDVYVAFNHSDSWVAASHDGGATFVKSVKTSPPSDEGRRYYYHYKGAVLSNDVVTIAATSLDADPYARGNIKYYVLRSDDGGASWTQIPMGTYKEQPLCPRDRCRRDHLGGMTNLAKDDNDNLVVTFAGATRKADGQVIFTRTSTNDGLTWSPATKVSPVWRGDRRIIASFPAVAGTGNGDFRMWWQDDRIGVNGWNTWYTESTDNGTTWSRSIRISDATNGAFYKSRKGYLADYGDYGGIDIMDDGRTIATWGEGESYWGSGGSWVNTQP